MSGFLPRIPEGAFPAGADLEHIVPELSEDEVRARWTVRTAQWRAWLLARDVFGDRVSVRLQGSSVAAGRSGAYPFRGLLHVTVPFGDPTLHVRRERTFIRRAQADPFLSAVPLVYVFAPREGEAGVESIPASSRRGDAR